MNKQICGSTIYQIYPRSFMDANNDGVGDIQGITNKLNYIHDLGVDYLWISPFFTSPMKDFGYDVSDYKDIDPIFGNLDDFKKMMHVANKLGLKIMLDLVLAHTSDQHPWFIESAKNKTNPKHDWYIWVDTKNKDQKPNNWLSVFGGSAWTLNPQRGQYYLHKFLKEQPNLNIFNPQVAQELLTVADFWLKLGVKGFRLDTVNYFYHDQKLRDNPMIKDDKKIVDAPEVNPYGKQEHLYDKNQPENIEYLKKLRTVTDKYDAILLGEVGAGHITNEIIKQYTAGNDKLQLCYGFDYIGGPLNVDYFVNVINDFWTTAPNSMICNSFGNHDCQRLVSRWQVDNEHQTELAKMCCALLLSLKGANCIYEGEELALTEYDIKYEEIQDPYGKTFYPEFKGRDGCRTPFVWAKNEPHGGFSTANKCWLPVDPLHLPLAVDQQLADKSSVLNFYKQFIKFKNNHDLLLTGDIKALKYSSSVIQIDRFANSNIIRCLFNLSNKTQTVPPITDKQLYSFNYEVSSLQAYGFLIYQI